MKRFDWRPPQGRFKRFIVVAASCLVFSLDPLLFEKIHLLYEDALAGCTGVLFHEPNGGTHESD